MLQIILGVMLGGGVLFSLLTGQGAAVFPALLGAAQEGVETAIPSAPSAPWATPSISSMPRIPPWTRPMWR